MASPLIKVTAEPRSLVAKLSGAQKAIKRIAKRGRNEFHKYPYATEADINDAIRDELASRNVMLIPEIVRETRLEIGKSAAGAVKVLTRLDMRFTFYDGDSGEVIVKRWKGWGVDSEDKGGYKATTGAEKYFLLKTFLIPTGDDPERDDQKRNRDQATAKPDRDVAKARKARGPLPSGVVYIAKVVPKSSGDREWVEIVTSDGESLIAREPGCINLAYQLAQEDSPVEIITSRNGKGNLEIEEITRWKGNQAPAAAGPEPPDSPVGI